MPQNLQNNPWFHLVLVVVFAAAIIYAGIEVFPGTREMQVQIDGLTSEIAQLNVIVNEGLMLEKLLPELRREIREKEKQLETLKKIIPTETEAEDLIRKLEHMASETNMSVRSFTPQGRVAKDFYWEWPIAIVATGNYHNLGRFFAKVSNYARIINIRGVNISAVPSKSPNETISSSFAAVTYVYKDEEKK